MLVGGRQRRSPTESFRSPARRPMRRRRQPGGARATLGRNGNELQTIVLSFRDLLKDWKEVHASPVPAGDRSRNALVRRHAGLAAENPCPLRLEPRSKERGFVA